MDRPPGKGESRVAAAVRQAPGIAIAQTYQIAQYGAIALGRHPIDQPRMIRELAEAKGWTVTETEQWLTHNEYVLHHAGGNTFQLIDGRLHGATAWGYNGVRHMGGAFVLRNH